MKANGRYKSLAKMIAHPKPAAASAGKKSTRAQQFKAAGRARGRPGPRV